MLILKIGQGLYNSKIFMKEYFNIVVRATKHNNIDYKLIKENYKLLKSDFKFPDYLNIKPEKFPNIDEYIYALQTGRVNFFCFYLIDNRKVLKLKDTDNDLDRIHTYCLDKNLPYALKYPNKFITESNDILNLVQTFCILNKIECTIEKLATNY